MCIRDRVEYVFELYDTYTIGLLVVASAKATGTRGKKPKRKQKV